MSLFEIIVLAVVQGLTEFIPVSSTAHLRIVPALLGWSDPGAAFSAIIQIGTLAAVVSYFWRDIVRVAVAMISELRQGKFCSTSDGKLGWMIVVGTVPIVACGLLFKDQIETRLRSLYVISTALAVVAILLAIAEWWIGRRQDSHEQGRDISQLTWRDAIVVGFMQAAALVPGTSRSGATILGGLGCGLSREAAARFSFLLSIPSIFAAGVYQLYKTREQFYGSGTSLTSLVIGLLVTAAVGYATIPWLLKYLRSHTMFVFIVYRLLLAAVIVALIASGYLQPN